MRYKIKVLDSPPKKWSADGAGVARGPPWRGCLGAGGGARRGAAVSRRWGRGGPGQEAARWRAEEAVHGCAAPVR